MRRGEGDGTTRGGGRASCDARRLAVGVGFMTLLLGVALAASFLLGRPPEGGIVAPGVPVLVLGGWVLIVGSAVVFYRTYPGGGGGREQTPSGGEASSREENAAGGEPDADGRIPPGRVSGGGDATA